MKTYILFAVTFLVFLCVLARYDMLALIQFTGVCVFLVSLFLMWKMLRWVVRTLAR